MPQTRSGPPRRTIRSATSTRSGPAPTSWVSTPVYPERTRTYELGLDARLWRHISLSASWYWADTYNQTFDPQISVSSGYSTIYLQTGHVRNTGVELSAGYDNTWRDFRWATNFTFSWNKNEIVELVHNYKHPETGEIISKDRLEIKGLGKAKYILKPGGTLGDLYTNSDLVYNQDGYIEVDEGAESRPALHGPHRRYLLLRNAGQHGPVRRFGGFCCSS